MMTETTEELVAKYFTLGFQQKEIIAFLDHLHNRIISQRTLKRILLNLNLSGRQRYSKLEDVVSFIETEISRSGKLHGYRWMHLRCLQNSLIVTQEVVRELLWLLDPQGVEKMTRKRLRRRQYFNKGPNYLWHVDSYDKLKNYGICINGCIDGFSRHIIWLQAGSTSSDPKVVAGYYLKGLELVGGCPRTIRSDPGTENKTIEKMQTALHHLFSNDVRKGSPFLYGKSVHNQRIESWWCILRKHSGQFWMNLFQMLKDNGEYDGLYLDKSLLQFCFMELIQVMIKFLDERIKPIKYILTPDNSLQQVVDITIDDSPLVTTALQSINELGKHLLKAASDGDAHEVKTLLSQGSPFTSDWLGTSPLHLAAQNNKIEVCEVLLKGGISKDARNKVDRTPLHLSAYEGHYQATETLIKHGSDVNCRDMLNMTPLHWAVQNGHTAVVELLVRNGAHIEVKNKFDLSPQDIAVQINKLEIVELLQAYEGDTQVATQTLVMQLEAEDQSNEGMEGHDDINEANPLDPVIVIDENEFRSQGSPLERPQDFNNEPVIINLCENLTEEYRQDSKNKDPVIINLAKDINEEMPQISQKSNMLNSNPITNFKIVDGVIQPSDEDTDSSFSAMQLLQEHGITMLPNDNEDSNILNAVMESGHSVVLTDVGKEVLNTVKQQEEKQVVEKPKPKKVITVTPEQFLSMTSSQFIRSTTMPGSFKVIPVKPNVRRVVMKKNRPTPFCNMIKVQSIKKSKTELENVMDELAEAKKTIEEYKSKLKKKEIEVERYKIQLKLLMNSS